MPQAVIKFISYTIFLFCSCLAFDNADSTAEEKDWDQKEEMEREAKNSPNCCVNCHACSKNSIYSMGNGISSTVNIVRSKTDQRLKNPQPNILSLAKKDWKHEAETRNPNQQRFFLEGQ
mmetsp:Transcript_21257/g.27466  ORF Transcript_21257/g.27466 Transcript_21257/m.27466 type:complete len:119 (-) Transcript_21257:193-549(-)